MKEEQLTYNNDVKGNGRFCSLTEVIKCPQCKKEFKRSYFGTGDIFFCSERCKQKWLRGHDLKKYNRIKKGELI